MSSAKKKPSTNKSSKFLAPQLLEKALSRELQFVHKIQTQLIGTWVARDRPKILNELNSFNPELSSSMMKEQIGKLVDIHLQEYLKQRIDHLKESVAISADLLALKASQLLEQSRCVNAVIQTQNQQLTEMIAEAETAIDTRMIEHHQNQNIQGDAFESDIQFIESCVRDLNLILEEPRQANSSSKNISTGSPSSPAEHEPSNQSLEDRTWIIDLIVEMEARN